MSIKSQSQSHVVVHAIVVVAPATGSLTAMRGQTQMEMN